MPIGRNQRVLGLVAFQVGDGVANAIPLQYLADDLERLGVPVPIRRAIPIIKGASAVGLLAGLRWPRLGRLTAGALVAYFACALGAHARIRDPAWRYVGAAGMLAWSAQTMRGFSTD